MATLPRGTVTFLFTDIEHSTRLWQAYPDMMPGAYTRHDAILRDAAQLHGGIVYKTVGDGFQMAFATAEEAVRAAIWAQKTLRAEVWPMPELLRVRMALHSGAVEPDINGDYRSPVLNRLGRLLEVGHGGQILMTRPTMELVRDHLPLNVVLRDHGERRLKDLSRPERIYQVLAPGLQSEFPALRTLGLRSSNLPLQATQFIGRKNDVESIAEMVRCPDVRLVTLTGPGGVGKTRLALQVASDLLDAFVDGVFVVELAGLTDSNLVPTAIAQALQITEDPTKALIVTLGEHFRDKELLLVLDNLEQIIDSASSIVEILAACPGIKVLVTSRIRLNVLSEYEYPIHPMDLPDVTGGVDAGTLTRYDSVRLFQERARAAQPTFAISDDNASSIALICQRLDGLPLAIELAASRIRMLSPEALLIRLESRLPMLAGGARDLPLRQQTMRSAIAWSFDLLSDSDRTLFRHLSVFSGGWTLDAAEKVVGDSDGHDVYSGLEHLVDHSLVRQVETSGEPRFTMLETIREFGQEQLRHMGQVEEVSERHARYYISFAQQAAAEPDKDRPHGWLELLDLEYDNLRSALHWQVTTDAEDALPLASALRRVWEGRGRLHEGRAWLSRILQATEGMRSKARADVWAHAGDIAYLQGDLSYARDAHTQSLDLSTERGNGRGVARALNALGNVETNSGNLESAQSFYERSRDAWRSVGDENSAAICSLNLGNLAAFRGESERAIELYEDALRTWETLGDIVKQGYALSNLGFSWLYDRRNPAEAARRFAHSLSICSERGDLVSVASCLSGIAGAVGESGQLHEAARLYGAHDALMTNLGLSEPPQMIALEERIRAVVGEKLGESAFQAAYGTGSLTPLVDTIQLAISMARGLAGTCADPALSADTMPNLEIGR